MKRSEVKISATLQDIHNAPIVSAWDEFCEIYGYNFWCLKEGGEPSMEVSITLEDAERWGVIED